MAVSVTMSTTTAPPRPAIADRFARSSICDHCGRWIGWAAHDATGQKMPFNIQPDPDGHVYLMLDGLTFKPAAASRSNPKRIAERLYTRHQCGRPSTPKRPGLAGHVDQGREARRQAILRGEFLK